MGNKLDLTGKTFGILRVVSQSGVDKFGHSKWLCECSCGVTKVILGDNLKRGMSSSCGQHNIIDISGKKFGRLTVVSLYSVNKHNHSEWLCLCECGNRKVINGNSLNMGRTRSCGCYSKEIQLTLKTTHGQSRTPEYVAWQAMKERCDNPDHPGYPDYGERGIKVFSGWRDSFENFIEYVGKRPSKKHSLDRINNDGNYEPGNVRWGTKKQQSRNTRRNIWIEHEGRKLVANDWAKLLGIDFSTVVRNIKNGLSFSIIYDRYKHRINENGQL